MPTFLRPKADCLEEHISLTWKSQSNSHFTQESEQRVALAKAEMQELVAVSCLKEECE